LEVYCKLEIHGNGNGTISCAMHLLVNLGSFPRIAQCHDLRALPEQCIEDSRDGFFNIFVKSDSIDVFQESFFARKIQTLFSIQGMMRKLLETPRTWRRSFGMMRSFLYVIMTSLMMQSTLYPHFPGFCRFLKKTIMVSLFCLCLTDKRVYVETAD
jgi:hypothetical protein